MYCRASATLWMKSSSRIVVMAFSIAALAAARREPGGSGAAEFALQELVELGRVRLALGSLHHLPDEKPEELVLAAAILGKLLRIGRHDGVDRLLDRGAVGDLPETLRVDDLVRTASLGPHRLEDFLGELARDRVVADPRQESGERRGGHAARVDLEAIAVERARKLAHHPVGSELG